jgi:hypothetical protein
MRDFLEGAAPTRSGAGRAVHREPDVMASASAISQAEQRRQFIADALAAGFTREQAHFLWEWLTTNGTMGR